MYNITIIYTFLKKVSKQYEVNTSHLLTLDLITSTMVLVIVKEETHNALWNYRLKERTRSHNETIQLLLEKVKELEANDN